MTQEQADQIDFALIREIKQHFVSMNVLPHEFTFTQFNLGKLKVTFDYTNDHPMRVELLESRASVSGSTPA